MTALTLPADRVIDALAHGAWVLLRLSGFMMTAPIFSNSMVPARIRVVLLLALTVLVAPLTAASVAPFAFDGTSLLSGANEILLGAVIGFTVQVAFDALSFAGTFTAMTMGLGFASLVDPTHHGNEQPVVGEIYQTLAVLMYLSVDGHLALLATLAESFRWMPPGAALVGRDSLWAMAGLGARLLGSGVVIALPAVVALLIVNLALGVVSRAAPQLNLYAVGFPVSVMFGLVVLIQVMPTLRDAFDSLLREGFGQAAQLAGAR